MDWNRVLNQTDLISLKSGLEGLLKLTYAKFQANYSKTCGPMNLLRCELGDISSKVGKYSIGGGKNRFTESENYFASMNTSKTLLVTYVCSTHSANGWNDIVYLLEAENATFITCVQRIVAYEVNFMVNLQLSSSPRSFHSCSCQRWWRTPSRLCQHGTDQPQFCGEKSNLQEYNSKVTSWC